MSTHARKQSMNDRSLHYRTCPLCEATCGLEVTVEGDALDGKVVRIRGDRDDVFSHGFICPKGSTLKQLHEDPDRLTLPMGEARWAPRGGVLGRGVRGDRAADAPGDRGAWP